MSEKISAALEHIKKEPRGINLVAEVKKKEKYTEDPVAAFLEAVPSDLLDGKNIPVLDASYLTDEQKAESMWALYKEAWKLWQRTNTNEKIKEEIAGEQLDEKKIETKKKHAALQEDKKKFQMFLTTLKEDRKKLQMILPALKGLYGETAVREIYLEESAREKKEKDDINGRFEEYREMTRKILTAETAIDSCAKQIFGSRGKGASEIDVLLYESYRRQLEADKRASDEILEDSGDLAALAEYQTIRNYSNQLRKEKFIWSPSRRKLLEKLEAAAFSGQPVLLSGESGTGKTRLVEQASKVLTGRICNETPGKDTRFQDLVAKQKIAPTGETYFEYKEIGEAVTGRSSTLQDQPEHDGRIVADDEFNLLETSEQTSRLARVAEWTPGKKVRMPVTNQEAAVAQNFLYCAMVNLASERYERKKIPPEVLRKFAKVDVGYPPQSADNPELYEMMLAALMDQNGRLRAPENEVAPEYEYKEKEEIINEVGGRTKATVRTRSLVDVKIGSDGKSATESGGFLWRFANAMGELNKSFSRQETKLKSRGEAQFVKDIIIDIGKILGFLRQYAKMGQNTSLESFVVGKLKEQFLEQEAYTKEDRVLVKDFLRYFGINVDASPSAIQPEFKNLSPVEVGLFSPRVEYRKIVRQEVGLNESFFINHDGTRVDYSILPTRLNNKEIMPGAILKGPDGSKIKFIGIRKDNGQPIFGPAIEEKIKKKKQEARGEINEISIGIAELQDALDRRAAEFNIAASKLETPTLPPDFTQEHLDVFKQFLGVDLEASATPDKANWAEYFKVMYPETQRPSDTKKGLVSHLPDWWEKDADVGIVGGTEKWGEAFIRSITTEANGLTGSIFLTEPIQKPNYIDGSQKYGTEEGLDADKDLILPITQEVLGADKNRFNNN